MKKVMMFCAVMVLCFCACDNKPKVDRSGVAGEHEYVDLGLSSGTLWATCNLGAEEPEGHGDFFAWGEPETKCSFTILYEGTIPKGKDATGSEYDPATNYWGPDWVMPTKDQYKELIEDCEWTWEKRGESFGYTVLGENGNSIFLPAAGYVSGSFLHDDGEYGYYWSGSFSDECMLRKGEVLDSTAWQLYFASGEGQYSMDECAYWVLGGSVRAVRK